MSMLQRESHGREVASDLENVAGKDFCVEDSGAATGLIVAAMAIGFGVQVMITGLAFAAATPQEFLRNSVVLFVALTFIAGFLGWWAKKKWWAIVAALIFIPILFCLAANHEPDTLWVDICEVIAVVCSFIGALLGRLVEKYWLPA